MSYEVRFNSTKQIPNTWTNLSRKEYPKTCQGNLKSVEESMMMANSLIELDGVSEVCIWDVQENEAIWVRTRGQDWKKAT